MEWIMNEDLFRCVLSSVLPLRSVGRSNFVRVCIILTTLIKKKTYFNENCCINILYIYILLLYLLIISHLRYIYIAFQLVAPILTSKELSSDYIAYRNIIWTFLWIWVFI